MLNDLSPNFVEDNKEGIIELNQKVATAIKNLNIDTTSPLSIAKCIKGFHSSSQRTRIKIGFKIHIDSNHIITF